MSAGDNGLIIMVICIILAGVASIIIYGIRKFTSPEKFTNVNKKDDNDKKKYINNNHNKLYKSN